MKRSGSVLLILISVILILPASLFAENSSNHNISESEITSSNIEIQLRDRLRQRIEAQPMTNGILEVSGKALYSQKTLPEFTEIAPGEAHSST